MSEPLNFGPCTRCPKVGRTDENGLRGWRDSSHYYCRRCRREYQKARYISPVKGASPVTQTYDRMGTLIKALGNYVIGEKAEAILAELEAVRQEIFTKVLGASPEALEGSAADGVVAGPSRRGPAKQTYDEMVRDWRLAIKFGIDENRVAKEAEILKYFPEYGLPSEE